MQSTEGEAQFGMRVKIQRDIHVGLFRLIAASYRAEEPHVLYTSGAEFRFMGAT